MTAEEDLSYRDLYVPSWKVQLTEVRQSNLLCGIQAVRYFGMIGLNPSLSPINSAASLKKESICPFDGFPL
jgi:hypothetical protein